MLKLSRKQIAKPKLSKTGAKASRSNPPPPQLKQLIEWVNLLPSDMKVLGELEALVHAYPEERLDIDQLILAEVQKLPDELKAFVGTFSDKQRTTPFGKKALLEMEKWPDAVRNEIRKMNTTTQKDEVGRRGARMRYDYLTQGQRLLIAIASQDEYIGPLFLATWLYRDKKGRLKSRLHPVLQSLIAERKDDETEKDDETWVDASRIRRCKKCEHIFWANHGNKQCCSEKCTRALQQAEYRKRYPEQIKQRRYELAEAKEKSTQSTAKQAKTTREKKHGS
jgi:hypothetical protein